MENTEITIPLEIEDLFQAGSSKSEHMAPPLSSPPPAVPITKVVQKRGSTKGTTNKSVKIAKAVSKQPDTYDLKGVVNLLILLGMTTVDLWEKVIYEIKQKVSDLMNTELTTLYFHLKMVANVICTGIAVDSDLSQKKLEMINSIDRDYTELLAYAEPVLSVLSKDLYTVETVKKMKDLIQESIKKVNFVEISDDEEEELRSVKTPRKRSSKVISEDEDDDGCEIDDDVEELFRQFNKKKGGNLSKSKKLLFSQQITTRGDDLLRKCVTPGEGGKYLMKIEITDCNDLKGVKPQQYWTKIWKKAVFLVNDTKDPSFTALNNAWTTQAKKILQIKDVKVTEFEESEDNDSRKRARFFR